MTLDVTRYAGLTAIDMMAGLAAGAWRSVELVEAAAALIAALEPALNTHVTLCLDAARATAVERDAERRAGRSRGALHGLPISIKDTYDVPGIRSTRGSRLYADHIATASSPLSQRVLAAGAIMMGKTTMPEFGWKASSTSPLTGPTRNPWDPRLTTGGSSSGSAAAVAARMVPAALGGDGGGSIRIPAAFCGVFGLKPSFGRIPVWPGSVHEQLVHHGVLTRTVRDTALMLDIGKGPDARDPWSLPADGGAFLDMLDTRLPSVRVAFVARPWGVDVDAEIAAVVAAICRDASAQRGWQVHDAVLPGALPQRCFEILWSATRRFTALPLLEQHEAMLDPALVRTVRKAGMFDLGDYLGATLERRRFGELLQPMFEDADVIALPTVPVLPFAAEADMPAGWSEAGVLPWIEWSPCTYPFNLSGNPAASVPVGFTPAGLPIGLQIVGPRGQDALVLRVCHAIESLAAVTTHLPQITLDALGSST